MDSSLSPAARPSQSSFQELPHLVLSPVAWPSAEAKRADAQPGVAEGDLVIEGHGRVLTRGADGVQVLCIATRAAVSCAAGPIGSCAGHVPGRLSVQGPPCIRRSCAAVAPQHDDRREARASPRSPVVVRTLLWGAPRFKAHDHAQSRAPSPDGVSPHTIGKLDPLLRKGDVERAPCQAPVSLREGQPDRAGGGARASRHRVTA
jgi:hypothetical protein